MYLRWVAALFAAFIVFCATSHLADVWTLWYPDYAQQWAVKTTTAAISLFTATALWPLLPHALSMPSNAQLAAANLALSREIEERRQVERSLRESQESLRQAHQDLGRRVEERTRQLRERTEVEAAILEGSPDAIISIDESGIILDWNRSAEQIFGFRRDAVLGRDIAEVVIPPRLREAHRQGMQRHRLAPQAGRGGVRLETSALHASGKEFPVELAVSHLASAGLFTAFIRDITPRKEAEEQLSESERRFRLLAANAPDVIWRIDPRGTVIDVSGGHDAILGLSAGALRGHRLRDFVHADDHYAMREFSERLESGDGSMTVTVRIRHRQGHFIWVESTGQALRDEAGHVLEIIAIARDITQRREDEMQIRLAATMFDSTQEGITITDVEGRILTVNPAFCSITGYQRDELIGKNPRILKSGRHDRAFYVRQFEIIEADGYWQGEIWNRRKNGDIYPEWLTISAVRDEQGKLTNYIGTFVDISRVKESELQLEHLAHHDPLTDLPNRLLLLSRLQHAVGRARRDGTKGAMLFLDLDHFKNVNDSLGHSAGDELLRMVAQRYQARLRDSDTLCRMGGDEFVVLLENLREPEHAAAVAQSLIEELREPFQLAGGQEVYVGTSVGISIFPDDSGDPDQIISNADAAMYLAKNGGRNVFRFYTEALTRAANLRVELESSLRRGLERDEFLLHYQPLVAMEDFRIIGVEALIRWQRPQEGLIPPGRFIAVAEETGLIVPMGTHVLRTACRQMKEWLDAGIKLDTMAVNLSAHQFQRPDLPHVVRAILDETGLPAAYLELEITESALMEFGEEAESKLCALKALGVRLAIDDFGTGYSSLAYLKRFPIDKLKVDQSFVQDIPGHAANMEIVAAVVGLARNLKMQVLAEGVETETQMAFLRALKCEAAQGYLFSRPAAALDLAELLHAGRPLLG